MRHSEDYEGCKEHAGESRRLDRVLTCTLELGILLLYGTALLSIIL